MSVLNAYTDEERVKLSKLGHIASGYFISPTSVTVTTAGTFYKVPAVFSELKANGFTWNGTLKRWDYVGVDITVGVFGNFTGSHNDTVASHVCQWKFFKNGLEIEGAPAKVNIDKNDSNAITLLTSVDIVSGDYIELYATIDNDGDDVITENMNIQIR